MKYFSCLIFVFWAMTAPSLYAEFSIAEAMCDAAVMTAKNALEREKTKSYEKFFEYLKHEAVVQRDTVRILKRILSRSGEKVADDLANRCLLLMKRIMGFEIFLQTPKEDLDIYLRWYKGVFEPGDISADY